MNESVREALAGALAGATTKTLLAPLDRLKLVVQLRGSIPTKEQYYQGPWKALTRIIHEEGFLALWRGNAPTILIQGGTSALNFMFMDLYKKAATRLVDDYSMQKNQSQRLLHSFTSGAFAGGTSIAILYPIGLMRTKLALDLGKELRLYPHGMRDVIRHSYQTNGFTSLYHGFSVALISVSLYRMVYLGGYDYIKSELVRHNNNNQLPKDTSDTFNQIPFFKHLMAAQFVSILASTIHYPLDSVRRRLMMQSDIATKDWKYRNARHCFIQIYRDEGVTGYFRGLGTNYVRSMGAALLLLSYDFFKSLF